VKFAEIPRLEIFEHEPGRDPYDEKALDNIVATFSGEGKHGRIRAELNKTLNVPMVIGHEEDLKDSGIPAQGWVEDVWREGRKLIGRVVRVPREMADAIKNGSYRHVSAEIYKDFETLGSVLRRIACLGGDIPAKKSLGEIAVQTYAEDGTGLEFTRSFNRYAEGEEMKTAEEIQAEFDAYKAATEAKEKELAEEKATLEAKVAELTKTEEDGKDLAEKFSEMEMANKAQKGVIEDIRSKLKDLENTRLEESILTKATDLAREKNIYSEDIKKGWVEFAKALPADKVDAYFETLSNSVSKTVETGPAKARTEADDAAEKASQDKEYASFCDNNNVDPDKPGTFTREWFDKNC
jgi:predicted  nucleic acid-binding Zn-ribbon protein